MLSRGFALATTLLLFGCSGVAGAHAPKTIPTVTTTALLTHAKIAHTEPSLTSPVVSDVAATRPLTGETTILPVVNQVEVNGTTWLRIRLPQRPNGSRGWVTSAGITLEADPWFISVDRRERRARIYQNGKLRREYPVIVGKPSTPTPSGHFFVVETLALGDTVDGPYALATSAYSNVLMQFEGGPGQLALHGIIGLDDPLGTASSHGCIRFSDAAVTWLATHILGGTPIDIY